MANYTNLKNIIDQYITTNGQGDITGAILNDVLKSIVNSIGADFLFAGVAEPTSNPGSPDQNVFYIAIKGGAYTHFGNVVIPNGITIFKWNGSWSNQILFAGDGGVFDITAFHNNTKYADLTAALGTNGANVPQSLQKGGMSVKFVQISDNRYVQFRCMAQSFTSDVTQWQGVDSEPVADSKNLVESGGVKKHTANKVIINSEEILFDKTEAIFGKALNAETGVAYDNPSYFVSPFIAYNPNLPLYVVSAANNKVFAYSSNSEDSFIRVIENPNGIPLKNFSSDFNNTAYIKVYSTIENYDSCHIWISGNPNPIEGYLNGIKDIEKNTEDSIEEWNVPLKNGGFSGTEITYQSNRARPFDIIPLPKNSVVKLVNGINTAFSVRLLSGSSYSQATSYYNYTGYFGEESKTIFIDRDSYFLASFRKSDDSNIDIHTFDGKVYIFRGTEALKKDTFTGINGSYNFLSERLLSIEEREGNKVRIGGFEHGSYTTATLEFYYDPTRYRLNRYVSVKAGDFVIVKPGSYKCYLNFWEGTIESHGILDNSGWKTTAIEKYIVHDGFILAGWADATDATKNVHYFDFDGSLYIDKYNPQNLGEKVMSTINASYSSDGTMTSNKKRVCIAGFERVFKGDKVLVNCGTSYAKAVILFSGDLIDPSTRYRYDSYERINEEFCVEHNGYMMVAFANASDATQDIPVENFDGYVKILRENYSYDAANPTKLRVATYNVGDYMTTDYAGGSDKCIPIYNKIIAKLKADILMTQEDYQYFNQTTHTRSADVIYSNMYKYISALREEWFHTMSYQPQSTLMLGIFDTFHGHEHFTLCKINVNGKDIYCINIHYDWWDRATRYAQIEQTIALANRLRNVIIVGDFNPSVRDNGVVDPETAYVDQAAADYKRWEDEGYRIVNLGYLGYFGTILETDHPADLGMPCDNIIVSPSIVIENAEMFKEDWMNDHCPLVANLAIY